MRSAFAAGIVLALCAAGLLNLSYVLQHRASNQVDPLSLRHPLHSLRLLAGSPLWLASFGGGWVGWGLYIAGLRLAPLSVVQAVVAGGLPLLAFLAGRFGRRVTPLERTAAMLGGTGAVLVCSTLGYRVQGARAGLDAVLAAVAAGVALAVALAALGHARVREGAYLGVASGLCYAVSDIATKGAVDGTGLVLVPVFLAASLGGFVMLQLGFQRGGVLETAGLSSLVATLLPIAAGVTLYHESLPPGPLGVVRVAGFALSVVGGVLIGARRLARVPGGNEVRAQLP